MLIIGYHHMSFLVSTFKYRKSPLIDHSSLWHKTNDVACYMYKLIIICFRLSSFDKVLYWQYNMHLATRSYAVVSFCSMHIFGKLCRIMRIIRCLTRPQISHVNSYLHVHVRYQRPESQPRFNSRMFSLLTLSLFWLFLRWIVLAETFTRLRVTCSSLQEGFSFLLFVYSYSFGWFSVTQFESNIKKASLVSRRFLHGCCLFYCSCASVCDHSQRLNFNFEELVIDRDPAWGKPDWSDVLITWNA